MLNGPNDTNDARDANASGTSRDDTSGVADIDGVGVSKTLLIDFKCAISNPFVPQVVKKSQL